MPAESDPHEKLGVTRDVSPCSLRRAFHREARKWHPDKRPADESEEERAAANRHFIEIHAAYEKLLRRDEGLDGPIGSADAVERSAKTLEQARASLAEAQEYLNELRESCRMEHWSDEELEVLMSTWRGAWRAVQHMHRAEIAAQAKFNLEKACMGLSTAELDPTTAEKKPVDGPRKMDDNFVDNLGQAFKELIFDFWHNVSWSNEEACDSPAKDGNACIQSNFFVDRSSSWFF